MLESDDFLEYPTLQPIVEKINKFLIKDKIDKVSKIIYELEDHLEDTDLAVPITYILSVFAENYIELIEDSLIEKIEPFLQSKDEKLKVNSIIILGFFQLHNTNYIKKYFNDFINFIVSEALDVRNNAHYFLQEFVKISPNIINSYSNIILNGLSLEERPENIISVLSLLNHIELKNIELNQLYKFREISKSLILMFSKDKTSEIFLKLIELNKKFFPILMGEEFQYLKDYEVNKILDDQFLMKKYNFFMKDSEQLRNLIAKIKKSPYAGKEIYFYAKDKKTKIISFYELEKEKLLKFFNKKNSKISKQKLMETFSPLIETDTELKLFTNTLIKLEHIKGFITNLGNYYPYDYLKSEIINDFQKSGLVNLQKKYQFLPKETIHNIVLDTKKEFLMGKNEKIYYSIKKIKENISSLAAKKNSINLRTFRDKLIDRDFIKLIKNFLPKEFLTNFRKGTVWLTNIGKLKILNEITNSRVVGFLNLNKISEKLTISKILLMDVLENQIDFRSGQWDKSKEIFYFSMYIKKKIDKINMISDEAVKEKEIEVIAKELNIEKSQIITKIDENLRSIGEEIKNLNQIKIRDYLEKTGMEKEEFMLFMNDLEINYFRKGGTLILNPKKIDEAKNSIKLNIIENSKSMDFISLGNFDITSNLIENLIKELKEDGKLRGIFYDEDNELVFYTEIGISNLMLDNSLLFSFEDLFYGKQLSQDNIDLLKEIFDNLSNQKKLKGTFDEETLTFSSDDVLFANDYNTNLHDLEKTVNNYISRFNFEFQKIHKILIKTNETIYPQEIKVIQDAIDRVNNKYVYWRDGLESFVIRANSKLLKDQGYSVKKFKALTLEKKEDIKSFEDDPEVFDLLKNFKSWVSLFNELELKYPNVIFYQKRLIKNPDDVNSKEKLNELLVDLNLII